MAILVDSSVWVDFFNGTPTPEVDLLDRLLGKGRLVVGDLIVAEVLQGFRADRDHEEAKEALLRFPVLPMSGLDLALASADNYRALRRRGVTVRKTVDCWIATFCLRENLELLHSDRDFDPFAAHLGLRVAEARPPASSTVHERQE